MLSFESEFNELNEGVFFFFTTLKVKQNVTFFPTWHILCCTRRWDDVMDKLIVGG